MGINKLKNLGVIKHIYDPDLHVNLNVMILPALEVIEKPYESSRAPKQTVDGIICIHFAVGKRTSTYMMT